jgi:hypothetical protein
MDLTQILQGGALAAIGATLGSALIKEFKRAARRGVWRRVRRSPAVRQWSGLAVDLLPYIGIALLAWWVTGNQWLIPFVAVPLFTAAIARRRKRKMIAYVLITLAAGAVCNFIANDAMYVVWLTGLIRYIWPYMWGKT